jgi:hypothetical protein
MLSSFSLTAFRSSGSLAMLAAIRRASSRVSSLAAARRPGSRAATRRVQPFVGSPDRAAACAAIFVIINHGADQPVRHDGIE